MLWILLATIFIGGMILIPIAFILVVNRERKWRRWEKAHGWPLTRRAYIMADEYIKAQRGLGGKATAQGFRDYIGSQPYGTKDFPIELCQVILNEVAVKGKDNAMPPKAGQK